MRQTTYRPVGRRTKASAAVLGNRPTRRHQSNWMSHAECVRHVFSEGYAGVFGKKRNGRTSRVKIKPTASMTAST
jgi:hypothetical protein